ncbi:MAG TPA: gfo/Idh/MocA family oxidoreductase [Bacteroidales bacterium]|nr:gfo/Idh/MocA family oxidoreductase [Bacteroidales bacterium]
MAVGAGAAITLPYIIPSSALGKDGAVAPSNRVVMGLIGSGSMGTGDMHEFMGKPDVQMVAACDVDKQHRESAKAAMDAKYGNSDARIYSDYREFLAQEKIDAVILALPDQWHGIIAVAAANAKLDIYGQKPLARTIWEGKKIIEAVEKNNVIWQTGSWQRSEAHFHRACELVINGRIGKVSFVEVGLPDGSPTYSAHPVQPVPEGLDWDMWLGPAPSAPYRGVCHWDWRWILDYSGGQLTDWAGHHIDIAHWGLGLDRTGPIEIDARGVYPRDGIFDVPVEYSIHAKYANGIEMHYANARQVPHGMGVCWYGDKGWIHVDRGERLFASDPKILEEKIGDNEIKLYRSLNHTQNLIDCIRSREETITPCQVAHRSISAALLGEISMLTGRKIKWNPDTQEIIDDPMASRLLRRPFRTPWKLEGN